MLDWLKIDNDKTFQSLVNHIFAIECNLSCFIPSSPYIGADDGLDGLFRGVYSYENLSGNFSIQAKWTSKSLKEAVKHLQQEIKNELKNSKKNNKVYIN